MPPETQKTGMIPRNWNVHRIDLSVNHSGIARQYEMDARRLCAARSAPGMAANAVRTTGTDLGKAADNAANSMRIFGIEASQILTWWMRLSRPYFCTEYGGAPGVPLFFLCPENDVFILQYIEKR